MTDISSAAHPDPSSAQIRRWRQYLADERAEAAVYAELAGKRTGEERAILLGLVEAERRHEAHWVALLGEHVGLPTRTKLRTRLLAFFARRFGSIFVLALMQQAETRSPYGADDDATDAMAADEQIHAEVVRGLAARGRTRLSGTFRAAVFGANDGLVSNLALVIGMAATGVSTSIVLASGIAGLLAGALSMGAGEFVSVRSQRELLSSTRPNPDTHKILPNLDAEANELALIYRTRGMAAEDAEQHARERLYGLDCVHTDDPAVRGSESSDRTADRTSGSGAPPASGSGTVSGTVNGGANGGVNDVESGCADDSASPEGQPTASDDEDARRRADSAGSAHEAIGSAWGAALSSFGFFSSGAIIPIIPFFFGIGGYTGIVISAVLVGLALLSTGAIVGILSGASPFKRALRQLGIGYGAALVTYLLGLLFGTGVG